MAEEVTEEGLGVVMEAALEEALEEVTEVASEVKVEDRQEPQVAEVAATETEELVEVVVGVAV